MVECKPCCKFIFYHVLCLLGVLFTPLIHSTVTSHSNGFFVYLYKASEISLHMVCYMVHGMQGQQKNKPISPGHNRC